MITVIGRKQSVGSSAPAMQDDSLVDWDDLDYQLAAASEELMKAHARAEQLTEEKLLLERRWAHMQANVQVGARPPAEFMFAHGPAQAESQAWRVGADSAHTALQGEAAAAKKPAPPPSLADTIPGVLKHAASDSLTAGSGSKVQSVRPDPVTSKGSAARTRTAPFSGHSYSAKDVMPAIPPSHDSQTSQPGRCASQSSLCP